MLATRRGMRKAEAVLTLTPSGDTEFDTAQPAGSSGASMTDAGVDTTGQVAPAQAAEELWDDSFKPPSTLQRFQQPPRPPWQTALPVQVQLLSEPYQQS